TETRVREIVAEVMAGKLAVNIANTTARDSHDYNKIISRAALEDWSLTAAARLGIMPSFSPPITGTFTTSESKGARWYVNSKSGDLWRFISEDEGVYFSTYDDGGQYSKKSNQSETGTAKKHARVTESEAVKFSQAHGITIPKEFLNQESKAEKCGHVCDAS